MSDGYKAVKENLESIGKGLNFYDWVLSILPIFLKGEPFSFEQHPELVQLYKDEHPNKKIRKGVQVGASTYAILYIFWRAVKMNKKGGYFGPTDHWVKKFTPDRVDKLIAQIPDVTKRLRKSDSNFLKDLGAVSVHLLGLDSASNVATADLDTRVIDEASIVKQSHREVSKDRLEHSSAPVSIEMSKPEAPGQGIDADFNESDQHYYLFKCPKCGKHNNVVLNWPDCCMPIGPDNSPARYLGCIYCRAQLDPKNAEWVPAYPSRKDSRGYQLSKLYWSWKPGLATTLWKDWKKCKTNIKKKRFWTGKIGVPYAGSALQITDAVLTLNQGEHLLSPFHPGPSFMGVDQGDTLHIVIAHMEGDQLVPHWFETTDNFERLDKLMDLHQVWCAVCDAMPNKHSAKDFAKRNKGYVYIAYYHDGEMTLGKEEKQGEEIPKVTVGRDESIDETIEGLFDQTIILSKRTSGDVMEDVWVQLKNLVKEKKEKANGGEKQSYMRNNNHYGMALNYCRIAKDLPVIIPHGLPLIPAGASFYSGGNSDH